MTELFEKTAVDIIRKWFLIIPSVVGIISISHLHLTLKMVSAHVAETSVANNSPSQDSNHPYYIPGSKN